jgi:hypothetical protein
MLFCSTSFGWFFNRIQNLFLINMLPPPTHSNSVDISARVFAHGVRAILAVTDLRFLWTHAGGGAPTRHVLTNPCSKMIQGD